MSEINSILKERNKSYGSFETQAQISQQLKDIIRSARSYGFKSNQTEALEMILHKISRIVNGDPTHIDSWQDIAGYAQLIVNDLKKKRYE